MTARDQPALGEVASEVGEAFAAYERALAVGDSEALVAAFRDSPDTVRFGVADRQHGFEEISRWRRGQAPLEGRALSATTVTALGSDAAVVTTLFSYPGRAVEGRQSQTWLRTPEGWRIASAHVSEVPLGREEAGGV